MFEGIWRAVCAVWASGSGWTTASSALLVVQSDQGGDRPEVGATASNETGDGADDRLEQGQLVEWQPPMGRGKPPL
jgi:hypothetical protein